MSNSLKELIQDKKNQYLSNFPIKDDSEYKKLLESFLIKTIESSPKNSLTFEVVFDFERNDGGSKIYINGQEQNHQLVQLFNSINSKKQFLSLPHKVHSIANDSPCKDLMSVEKLTHNSLLITLL